MEHPAAQPRHFMNPAYGRHLSGGRRPTAGQLAALHVELEALPRGRHRIALERHSEDCAGGLCVDHRRQELAADSATLGALLARLLAEALGPEASAEPAETAASREDPAELPEDFEEAR